MGYIKIWLNYKQRRTILKIIRCTHCNKPLFEAEENTIVIKTCPECKVQNKIKVRNSIRVETDKIINFKKIN